MSLQVLFANWTGVKLDWPVVSSRFIRQQKQTRVIRILLRMTC